MVEPLRSISWALLVSSWCLLLILHKTILICWKYRKITVFILSVYFSHEELLAHGGHYYDMWQQQLTKLEETEEKNGNSDSAVITVEDNGQ